MFLPEKTESQIWVGVVIAVPEPWVSQLSEMRQALGDPQGASVPPHITLVPPLAIEADDREAVITHLQTVAQHFPPFRIRLGKVESFYPISPVVYLALDEGAAACAALADEIRGGPLNYKPRFPYHPHVTLLQGSWDCDVPAVQEAVADLDAHWQVSGYRLDRVSESGTYSSAAIFNFAL